jgi:hypothetical protein
MHRVQRTSALAALAALALVTACGGKKTEGPTPPAPSSAAFLPVSAAPPAPESPLSVVLSSRGPLVLSGLEGGVFVADVAHTHLARASIGGTGGTGGELTAAPMPEGLPGGRVLAAAGRLPSPVWLLYETPKDDGKGHENPLFRLGKEGWKKYADDWKPAIAAWTKHRILAASTSSGRLKVKVIEPSLATPPADLPSPRLDDASCEKTLHIEALATLASGEVLAAGSCKPDTAAGAGASAARYVVIRWGAPGAGAADAGAADAGAGDAGAGDAGAGEAVPEGPPGVVEVIPGVSTHLQHEALYARAPGDVWAAAREPGGVASRLFHLDGATWGPVALPPGAAGVRALAGTSDGTLWMATARAVWRRDPAGAWSEVPPPERAFQDGGGAWEIQDLTAPDGRDVWIAARRTSASGPRDLVLRTRPAADVVRWE